MTCQFLRRRGNMALALRVRILLLRQCCRQCWELPVLLAGYWHLFGNTQCST